MTSKNKIRHLVYFFFTKEAPLLKENQSNFFGRNLPVRYINSCYFDAVALNNVKTSTFEYFMRDFE